MSPGGPCCCNRPGDATGGPIAVGASGFSGKSALFQCGALGERPERADVHGVLREARGAIDRQNAAAGELEVAAGLGLINAVRSIAPVVAADLHQAAHPEVLDIEPVLERRVGARGLRVAEAGVRAGIADRREGVGTAHRVVGVDRVQRQGVDAAASQRAVGRVAEAEEPLRVERLTRATRICVGRLEEQRLAVVLNLRLLRVSQINSVGIEAGFRGAYDRPPVADWLAQLDADDRLAKAVRGPKPLRTLACSAW